MINQNEFEAEAKLAALRSYIGQFSHGNPADCPASTSIARQKDPTSSSETNFTFVPVISAGRAGSTLLMRLLNTIPYFHISGERAGILRSLSQSISGTRDPIILRRRLLAKGKEEAVSEFDRLTGTDKDPWYRSEHIDTLRFARSIGDVFMREIVGVRSTDKNMHYGYKDISFVDHLDDFTEAMQNLQLMYNQTRFVFLQRRPEDIAKSGWWQNEDREQSISKLIAFHSLQDSFAANNKEACLTIQFQNLTIDNAEQLCESLSTFFGTTVSIEDTVNCLRDRLHH